MHSLLPVRVLSHQYSVRAVALLESGCIATDDIIANAASGVTGAGRQASVANLLTEVSDSFKAYGASGHRHQPEIEQGLADIAGAPVV